jgi:hypothetical protein
MNVPYTAIHFATYESSKTYFSKSNAASKESNEETLTVQVSCVIYHAEPAVCAYVLWQW